MTAVKSPPARRAARARIFLVDDHEVVRAGLTALINRGRDMEVVGEAASAGEALRKIGEALPDAVILDLSLGGTSGLTLLKDLQTRHPGLKVLVLSMHSEDLYAERALHAGAMGYVMKQQALEEVREAARAVLSGRVYVSPRMAERLIVSVARGRAVSTDSAIGGLSDRELEVFELIGHGVGTRAIADRLHLSVKTVETHRANIKDKLGLSDGPALAAQAAKFVIGS
ncbi:MAG: response regulator transcription factor [Planctomycetes bacterium]|nr:response regulator transcription factor [Planctomycetota bacterium]